MKKLYICEYPYVLYKMLIERMGDEENSYSLILGNSRADLEPMVPVLRRSGLFEQVEFFPSEPYKYFYDLISFDRPRNIFTGLINYPRVLFQLKKFKEVEFPFEMDFKQYDKIICSDGVYVMSGYLNMNHIEYALSEHAIYAFRRIRPRELFAQLLYVFYFILGILDKLHILIGPRTAAGFCKEIIVNDETDVAWPFRFKKVTGWNVGKHIEALDAEKKDRIFQLYADSYGLKIDATQTYDLLLTSPLYSDSMLPSEEKQIKFYKNVIRDYFSYPVLIKPHPRDTVDYKKLFPECTVIDRGISAEVLSFSQHLKLDTVFTVDSTAVLSFQEKAEKVVFLDDPRAPVSRIKV